jgi:hypothetical protein
MAIEIIRIDEKIDDNELVDVKIDMNRHENRHRNWGSTGQHGPARTALSR